MPSASGGQVGPEASPHSVGGGEGWQVTELCLPGLWRPLGTRLQAPPPSPGHINIYLGKAKANPEEFLQDSAGLLGGLAEKGNLDKDALCWIRRQAELGVWGEGRAATIHRAPPYLVSVSP